MEDVGIEENYKLTSPSSKSAPIFSIRFHPQKDLRMFYATGPLGLIYMSRLRSQTFQCVATEDNQTMAMDINSSGDRLVTGGNDLKIRFYDPKTMQLMLVYGSLCSFMFVYVLLRLFTFIYARLCLLMLVYVCLCLLFAYYSFTVAYARLW
uniref:Anaphase-promoting complex subunit 4 WD40 domain-containing protein n=1 Tax=Strigamia maritima TaxID=126957 RepID=T1JP11_STRMM